MKRDVTLPEALSQRLEKLHQKALTANLIPTQDKITLERTRLNVHMENLNSLTSLSYARVEGVIKKFHGKSELPEDPIDREILGFYEASLEVNRSYEAGYALTDEAGKKRFNVLSRYHETSPQLHFRTEADKNGYRKVDAWVEGISITGQKRNMYYAKPENIQQFMDDLNGWANERLAQGLNPLIVAAIYHVEFEAIHPWVDENGRDGRLRIYEMLGKQLTLNGNLLLEEFIAERKKQYTVGNVLISDEIILDVNSKNVYIDRMNKARGLLATEPAPPGYIATVYYETVSEREGNPTIFIEYFADIYENALNKAIALQPAVHREVA